jgi:hypothetical protein
MEYAILFYFDEVNEVKINSIISKIAKESGNKYMIDNNIPPHISILLFQYDKTIDTIINIIENNKSNFNKTVLKIASIGIFIPNVLFLSPIVDTHLMEANKNIIKIINQNEEIIMDKNYMENDWVPHISLGVKLNEDELIKGLKILVKDFTYMDIKINRMGLAECNPFKVLKVWEL